MDPDSTPRRVQNVPALCQYLALRQASKFPERHFCLMELTQVSDGMFQKVLWTDQLAAHWLLIRIALSSIYVVELSRRRLKDYIKTVFSCIHVPCSLCYYMLYLARANKSPLLLSCWFLPPGTQQLAQSVGFD